MRNFRWLLNWSLQNLHVNESDIIPVRRNGKLIGQCKVTIEENQIIGNFTLNEDLDHSQYVLYSISLPNLANQIFLEGILLVDYYDGLEKKAKKVEDMS